ncbi:hypothetical protein BC835DRAFT_1378024 [Cytidiella melzeri]|nr:hypothetical protein BC835DRAFT_1378024 [Cytidiella melzeri]
MSTVQNFGKGVIRVAKNYTKGYSDVQAKVREATSNDPWGPSGTQMNELAQLTYNQNDFIEIMEMLDKRLNDKGKNWRHVFKSLTVLDYLLHAGSENVVIYFRDNLYVIKTLKEFQFVDEYGKDQGANVRQKAKDISNLLTDEARLRQERRSRANMRDRMIGSSGEGEEDFENENARRRSRTPTRVGGKPRGGDDDELKRAIEESKRSLAEEQARKGVLTAEERDLQQALKLSEDEERKRADELAKSNQNSLFDDQSNNLVNLNAETNPFPLVDTGGNQFGGIQPQFTQQVPQFTSFNPYQAQMQQEALQTHFLASLLKLRLLMSRAIEQAAFVEQQEWQQQQQLQQQQELFAQQQAQQQQEEWFRQQQLLQMQAQSQQLVPQPTGFGSNNPFAAFGSGPSSPSNSFLSPSSQPPQQSHSPVSFNLQGTYNNSNGPSLSTSNLPSTSSFSPPPQPQSAPPTQRAPTKADQEHANLANLFANRDDGVDSFGNYGQLRYGQQASRFVGTQKTGATNTHNPFAQQQQQSGSDQPFFSI